jgi:hypothetical protein
LVRPRSGHSNILTRALYGPRRGPGSSPVEGSGPMAQHGTTRMKREMGVVHTAGWSMCPGVSTRLVLPFGDEREIAGLGLPPRPCPSPHQDLHLDPCTAHHLSREKGPIASMSYSATWSVQSAPADCRRALRRAQLLACH